MAGQSVMRPVCHPCCGLSTSEQLAMHMQVVPRVTGLMGRLSRMRPGDEAAQVRMLVLHVCVRSKD